MIIGIYTFLTLLFGGGSVDQFYIDQIDKGVKKYVADKDRKKEIQGYFDEYQSATANWNKLTKIEIKEFKKRNLDRGASLDWYRNYFEGKILLREELINKYIDLRLKMQESITDGEWAQIMELASEADTKEEAKEEKEKSKQADKDMFKKLREVTAENVDDAVAQEALILSWNDFEEQYNEVAEAYRMLDVNHTEIMSDKYATAEEFMAVGVVLIEIRAEAAEAFMEFITILKDSTTDDGYTAIMKEFNKLVG